MIETYGDEKGSCFAGSMIVSHSGFETHTRGQRNSPRGLKAAAATPTNLTDESARVSSFSPKSAGIADLKISTSNVRKSVSATIRHRLLSL